MVGTFVFKLLHIGAAVLLVLVFALSAAGTQPVQAAPSTLISAGWLPFSGSFPTSNIHLNGLVHIVARWQSLSASQVQVDISANLPAAGVTVTTDSGIPYTAFGGGTSSVSFPNDPIFPNDPVRVIVPSILLVTVGEDRPLSPNPILPPNPIQPFRFAMQFDLVFSAAGMLDLDASTVQLIELPDVGEE